MKKLVKILILFLSIIITLQNKSAYAGNDTEDLALSDFGGSDFKLSINEEGKVVLDKYRITEKIMYEEQKDEVTERELDN